MIIIVFIIVNLAAAERDRQARTMDLGRAPRVPRDGRRCTRTAND
jgi:hypothetical protein